MWEPLSGLKGLPSWSSRQSRSCSPQRTKPVAVAWDSAPISHFARLGQRRACAEEALLACEREDEDQVEQVLDAGDSVDEYDKMMSPLHRAAVSGDCEEVQQLLSEGADVMALDTRGRTPLHLAAGAAKLLVDPDVSLAKFDEADASGRVLVAKLLLDKRADVHAVALDGTTALHEAVKNDHLLMADLLLARGAAVEKKGQTPLPKASEEMQALLCKAGCPPAKQSEHVCMSPARGQPQEPLSGPSTPELETSFTRIAHAPAPSQLHVPATAPGIAADPNASPKFEQPASQMSARADTLPRPAPARQSRCPLFQDADQGRPGLPEGCTTGHSTGAHQLLQQVVVGFNVTDKDGMAALHKVPSKQDILRAQLLLASGAYVEGVHKDGTASHQAALQVHSLMAQLQQDNGADVEAVDKVAAVQPVAVAAQPVRTAPGPSKFHPSGGGGSGWCHGQRFTPPPPPPPRQPRPSSHHDSTTPPPPPPPPAGSQAQSRALNLASQLRPPCGAPRIASQKQRQPAAVSSQAAPAPTRPPFAALQPQPRLSSKATNAARASTPARSGITVRHTHAQPSAQGAMNKALLTPARSLGQALAQPLSAAAQAAATAGTSQAAVRSSLVLPTVLQQLASKDTKAAAASPYTRIANLGKGAYGVVDLAIDSDSKSLCAVKKVDVSKKTTQQKDKLRGEAEVLCKLRKLRHPHIVDWLDTYMEGDHLCIVMEHCLEGDLGAWLAKQARVLSEEAIMRIFVQVCLALQCVHSCNVVHRDVKPSNILITDGGGLKLGDFGAYTMLNAEESHAPSCVGTKNYMCPEVADLKPYGNKCDIWSVGCVGVELCVGPQAFTAMGPLNALSQDTIDARILRLPGRSAEFKDLLRKLLRKRSCERPDIKGVCSTPLVKKYTPKPPVKKNRPKPTVELWCWFACWLALFALACWCLLHRSMKRYLG